MSPYPMPHTEQHILSPTSFTSEASIDTTDKETLVQTSCNSNPCSPLSSISSVNSLRSRHSFSTLPKLTIPRDSTKMPASTRSRKRKRDAAAEVAPVAQKSKKKRSDVSTQVGTTIEAKTFEALMTMSEDLPELLLSLPCLFQTLAEFREERLEAQARLQAMGQELTQTRKLLKEHGIKEQTAA